MQGFACYGANYLLLSNNPQLASPWLMGYKAGAERGAEVYKCLNTVMPSIKLVEVSTDR
jgi:hypothetical protein